MLLVCFVFWLWSHQDETLNTFYSYIQGLLALSESNYCRLNTSCFFVLQSVAINGQGNFPLIRADKNILTLYEPKGQWQTKYQCNY